LFKPNIQGLLKTTQNTNKVQGFFFQFELSLGGLGAISQETQQ
jgi:hypothetical protein